MATRVLGLPSASCGHFRRRSGARPCAVLAAAGLQRCRFHDLRHTAIISMVTHGIPPHVVARNVGHSTISTTLAIYAKVVGSSLREAAAVMDHAFSGADATATESAGPRGCSGRLQVPGS